MHTNNFAPLLCLALLTGCAALQPAPAPAPLGEQPQIADPQPVLDSPEARFQFHVMAGEMAAGREQPRVAAAQFLEALKLRPEENGELAARATALAVAAQDLPLAVDAAETWLQSSPRDARPREVLVRLYLNQGAVDKAVTQGRALVDGHAGGKADGYRSVALLLSQDAAHGAAAMQVMQTLAQADPTLPGAHYAVGLLAVRYNQLDQAEQAARKALALAPHDHEASLLLAGVQIKQGRLAEAERTMDAVLAKNPDAVDLRLGYAKLLLESNQPEAGKAQLERVLQAEPDNADALYALALLSLEQGDIDAGERRLKALIKLPDAPADAPYYLGRVAETRGDYAEALKWYQRVGGGGQSLDAAIRIADVNARLGRIDAARAMLGAMRRQYPQLSQRLYLAEGEMLVREQRAEAAISVYDAALDEMPDDPDLLYGRSLAYEAAGQLDRAEADLRQMIADDPKDARALNALGYMLTVHSERYEEALALIERAHTIEPEDPAVIDSLGWVQYRLGRVETARDLLRQAFDKVQDPEIAAHLGEVLWQLGERAEAKAIWEAALQEAPEHAVLRETVQRLSR